jgi:hypothetical protein
MVKENNQWLINRLDWETGVETLLTFLSSGFL